MGIFPEMCSAVIKERFLEIFPCFHSGFRNAAFFRTTNGISQLWKYLAHDEISIIINLFRVPMKDIHCRVTFAMRALFPAVRRRNRAALNEIAFWDKNVPERDDSRIDAFYLGQLSRFGNFCHRHASLSQGSSPKC